MTDSVLYTDDGDGHPTRHWQAKDSRLWSAHRAQDQELVLAYVLPQEVDVIVLEHLRLLGDIGGPGVGSTDAGEQGIRIFALARIRGFVSAGVISERHVNLMSRLVLGEDIFLHDDEDSLRLADLNYDLENDDCLVDN